MKENMMTAENAALRTALLQLSWRLGKIDRVMVSRETLITLLMGPIRARVTKALSARPTHTPLQGSRLCSNAKALLG